MESWINKQTNLSISRFDIVMDEVYPNSKKYSKDAQLFIDHIKEKTNYFEAVEVINWEKIIPRSSSVVDLGCGIGWLSAYLSRLKNVKSIFCIDSSKNYIKNLLPMIFKKMNGNLKKVKVIEGLFYPIILDENSTDIVVICASIHHADDFEHLLKEIHRILKSDGKLVILNEDPRSYFNYLIMSLKFFIKVFFHLISKKFKSTSQCLNYSNILTDPDLGDRAYPEWALIKILKLCSFKNITKIDSKYPHNKKTKYFERNSNLVHFVCEK